MKIRNGYVSNSSSSSFVVEVSEEIPNVISLAIKMLNIMHQEDVEENNGKPSGWGIRKKQLAEEIQQKLNENKIDVNMSVCFKSCNFDTFIVREDNLFLVDTCNNHEWQKDIAFKSPYEFFDKVEETDWLRSHDFDDYVKGHLWTESFNFDESGDEFYHIDYDKHFKAIDINKYPFWCDECGCDYIFFDGSFKCPNCNKERKDENS
jgi:hypothetical protein